MQHELMTTEFVIDEVAKSLDLNPSRFNLVASLLGCHILPASELSEFHHKIVPEMKLAAEGKYKVGFERVIRAVVNYVRALPSVEDFEAIGKDVFGSDSEKIEAKIRKLREAVKYFYKGTKEGYVKHNKMPKKSKNPPTIKLPGDPKTTSHDSEAKATDEAQKSSPVKKEADLVEAIALDLDQLDLDETVEKVKTAFIKAEEEASSSSSIGESDLVQALASGAEVAASAEGKYPHDAKGQKAASIKIPPAHFEVRKTAIERHRLGQMSPLIYQLLTKGEIKFPAVMESDVLPEVHRFYQPLRSRVYAILYNLYHARFDRRQLEDKVKGMRRKADELRRSAKKAETDSEDKSKAESLREEANKLVKEAAETKLPEEINYKGN